jgi:hypothetical protein
MAMALRMAMAMRTLTDCPRDMTEACAHAGFPFHLEYVGDCCGKGCIHGRMRVQVRSRTEARAGSLLVGWVEWDSGRDPKDGSLEGCSTAHIHMHMLHMHLCTAAIYTLHSHNELLSRERKVRLSKSADAGRLSAKAVARSRPACSSGVRCASRTIFLTHDIAHDLASTDKLVVEIPTNTNKVA